MRRHHISFFHAWNGIIYNFSTQPNFRVHIFFALLAVILGFYFQIEPWQWLIVVFTITLVIVAEMINTALESIVDLVTTEHQENAKIAKDTAAGMVLVTAIMSLIVAILIFAPYFIDYLPLITYN